MVNLFLLSVSSGLLLVLSAVKNENVWSGFNFVVDSLNDFKPVFDEATVSLLLFAIKIDLGGFRILQNNIGFVIFFLPSF